MNKRQAKKASKKVTAPLVDEFNLLTLSTEEYEKAMEDYWNYVQKHCRYKHYKDRWEKGGKPFSYNFPVGKAVRAFYEKTFSLTRTYNEPIKTTQSLDDLKKSYGSDTN